MKEKQYLISEEELNKWLHQLDANCQIALTTRQIEITLDRDEVEQAIKESAVSITLGNDEKLFAVDIEVAINNICSLAVQPVLMLNRDEVKNIVWKLIEEIHTYKGDVNKTIDQICSLIIQLTNKKGEAIAKGELLVETDLTHRNNIWDYAIKNNGEIISLFDLLKKYIGQRISISKIEE
jgi:hypothetical protein